MKNDIYTLAHEMRNPLCVVKGYLEMLDESNILKYKRIMQNEINGSLSVLNDYLEYNRISLNKEEMDLNVLLSDLKSSFKDYLRKNNVHLHVEMYNDEIYLEADYNKLKQVFENAIKNSIESHSKNIYIDYHVMFGKVTICIKNDGDKMDEDSLIKIGHYFSNKEDGNGIGTSITKKIISLHNGKIKYRNNKKFGISVYITLALS